MFWSFLKNRWSSPLRNTCTVTLGLKEPHPRTSAPPLSLRAHCAHCAGSAQPLPVDVLSSREASRGSSTRNDVSDRSGRERSAPREERRATRADREISGNRVVDREIRVPVPRRYFRGCFPRETSFSGCCRPARASKVNNTSAERERERARERERTD